MWILNPENYCISWRHGLLSQTTKQPSGNLERVIIVFGLFVWRHGIWGEYFKY